MSKYKNKYRSESHRLRYWDYSAPSAYFITGVVYNRKHIFGHIENKRFIPSEFGIIAQNLFLELPKDETNIILDEFIIMPNHFHCIIIIKDDEFSFPKKEISEEDQWRVTVSIDPFHELFMRGKKQSDLKYGYYKNLKEPTKEQMTQFKNDRRKMKIPALFGKYKMQISKEINKINNTPGKKNWQDEFYDIIIRNNHDYQNIKNYIRTNPKNWKSDRFSN